MPDNLERYKEISKRVIDDYCRQNDFKNAFITLIAVLNNLDQEERSNMLRYYTMFFSPNT